jgi:hypothetical protein
VQQSDCCIARNLSSSLLEELPAAAAAAAAGRFVGNLRCEALALNSCNARQR